MSRNLNEILSTEKSEVVTNARTLADEILLDSALSDSTKLVIEEYLAENLSISVCTKTEFGPAECVEVTLYLNGREISSSSTSLPDRNI